VVVEQLSKIDIPALVARFPDPQDPDLKNNMAKNLEGVQQLCARVKDQTGRMVYRHIYVLDLSGLTMALLRNKEHLKSIFHVAEFYYPETLHR